MRVVFAVLIAIVIFWYTIPLALISVLANLAMSEFEGDERRERATRLDFD